MRPPGSESATELADLRLVLPAMAVWLVAWQGRLLPSEVLLAAAGALLLVGVAILLHAPRGRAAVLAATCVCAAAAGLVTGFHTGSRTTGVLAELAADDAAAAVEAVLTDDPRRALSAGGPGRGDLVVVRLRVDRLEARGDVHRLRAPVVLLATEPTWLALLPSQRVRVEGRLRAAEPGDDVAAVLSGRGPPEVLSPPSLLQRAAGHLRAGLREAVAPLPEAEQGLLPGLVVGDVSRLDAQVREDFRTTGLTHLTAVSGVNVPAPRKSALAGAGTPARALSRTPSQTGARPMDIIPSTTDNDRIDWRERANRQIRALCCRCGRTLTTTRRGRAVGEASAGEEASGRCLVWRKCATCGEQTDHAFLRDGDGEHADYAERVERERLLQCDVERLELADLKEEVARLRACEVRVRYHRADDWLDDDHAADVFQFLDDGTYYVRLRWPFPAYRLQFALGFLWRLLLNEADHKAWVTYSAKPGEFGDVPFRAVCVRVRK